MNLSHLTVEWHPTKNLPLTSSSPLKVLDKYWWLGACGHEWEAVLANRKRGSGCPICAGQQVLAGFNDLASQNPKVAAEWHPTRNSLSPDEVNVKSAKKFWWQAACGHEWETMVSSRTSKGGGCPVCSGRRVLIGFNDLATKNPKLASEWHPTKNGILTAQHAVTSSNKKVWWQCAKNHEWEANINNRTWLGNGCPYCGDRKFLSGYNDLATKNPELASEWHPTKNGTLTAALITAANPKKVWWLGPCGHEWEAVLSSRAQGVGCPICANQQVLVGFNDLATTDPDLAAEWHPTKNGELHPELITRGSKRIVWWLGKCGHEWQASVKHRSGRGDGCSVCAGYTFITGINDLATLYPDIAAQWHPTKNGDLKPSVIGRSYENKVWWLGKCGHEWEVSPHTRTGNVTRHSKTNADGCFVCKNVSKIEEEVKQFLISLGLTVESSNRKILGGKEIDLWIPEKKVGIEVNGLYWHRESVKGKDSHLQKWLLSQEHGIKLFQIWEDDWKARPELVMETLARKLEVVNPVRHIARNPIIQSIRQHQAETFLNENHLEGFAPGTYYVGLFDERDIEKLEAVMVLDVEPGVKGEILNILRYATRTGAARDFAEMLSYVANVRLPKSFVATSDNCMSDAELYKGNGFIKEGELVPEYMYLFRNKRMTRSELSALGITNLNGLDRIWDAGKTRYRLSL